MHGLYQSFSSCESEYHAMYGTGRIQLIGGLTPRAKGFAYYGYVGMVYLWFSSGSFIGSLDTRPLDLRIPPDKRAFLRADMFVCQPWLWLDTFMHHQFRGITSIKGITSISSSTGITSSHECGFARHTSPNKTDSYFFSGPSPDFASLLCGPSPVLRAFSGFACFPNLCVLAHFYLLF